MPRTTVEKEYRFDGQDRPVGLLDRFEERRQLIVHRLFYEPSVAGWRPSQERNKDGESNLKP
jgi:predicted dithiol-disulfide oxidoreductase (DUF899 family)